MRYVGGKGRISRDLANAMLAMTTERSVYVEPFVGGAAVFERMAPHFETALAGDLSPDLVALWTALLDGWEPPATVTEEEYKTLRNAAPSALRGLVGFGGSFGGKWFGGYARGGFNGDTPRNHYGESARSATATAEKLRGRDVGFYNDSYSAWRPLAGDVVYCDPPYAKTLGYSVGVFDSPTFWATARRWAEDGAHVFVSEYEAPSGWSAIWEGEVRQSVTMPSQGRALTVERLFTLDG